MIGLGVANGGRDSRASRPPGIPTPDHGDEDEERERGIGLEMRRRGFDTRTSDDQLARI